MLCHPQVVQSQIDNNCLKVSTNSHIEKQLLPNLLLHVSVRELHNGMVSPPEEGGIKEARDERNNIIIGDSALRNIIMPKLKNIVARYKVLCGFISTKNVYSSW